jgi:hypothetical protein
MAQMGEDLPSMQKTLSSIPSPNKWMNE